MCFLLFSHFKEKNYLEEEKFEQQLKAGEETTRGREREKIEEGCIRVLNINLNGITRTFAQRRAMPVWELICIQVHLQSSYFLQIVSLELIFVRTSFVVFPRETSIYFRVFSPCFLSLRRRLFLFLVFVCHSLVILLSVVFSCFLYFYPFL